MQVDYTNIPHEMRLYNQWCVWRYEDKEGVKPTKVPYSARTGTLCSVSDPTTWSTYQDALSAVSNTTWYDGIGFVLSEADPYCFIDLDDPYVMKPDGKPRYDKPQDIIDTQLRIYNTFQSYAERSPGGKGLHILVKATVTSGRKRGAVEIYSSERYLTMTGAVYRPTDIIPCQELITQLWEQMGKGQQASYIYAGLDDAKYTDSEVFDMAQHAENGDKFLKLHNGAWEDIYPSHSEADQAYINILAFYTQNRVQITRMFQASALGKRTKASRKEYIEWTTNLAFDRMLPPIDMDGLQNNLAEAIALKRKEAVAIEAPAKVNRNETYSIPPGLLGSLAQFIYAATPRQVPEIALAGAIGLLAGIVGRSYNISGTGLNQYVLLLAPTGTGKEAIASGIDKLMAAVQRTVPAAVEFIGPGEIMSQQALIKYLAKTSPCFVSVAGEFALMLQQMSDRNASPHNIGLRRMYLDLYNKSGEGKQLRPIIYSEKEKNTPTVQSPSFTLLGESTPERFYNILTESMIYEGLLPRFLTIEYRGPRPELNEQHTLVFPSFDLIEHLATLCAHSLMLNSQHKAINVKADSESALLFTKFDKHCDANINGSDKEISRQLWNRAHIKAMKLAALVAIGCDPYQPIINAYAANWAITLVVADVRNLIERFDAGEVGSDNIESKQLVRIVGVIRDYVLKPWSDVEIYKCGTAVLHSEKILPYSYLHKRLAGQTEFKNDKMGATNAVKRSLKTLVERGDLQEVSRTRLSSEFKTTAVCYMIAIPRAFGL